MTAHVQVPVEVDLLEEAKALGKHNNMEDTIREALATYIRAMNASRFFDVAAETDWEPPPEKKP
jgi:hypothetical protein